MNILHWLKAVPIYIGSFVIAGFFRILQLFIVCMQYIIIGMIYGIDKVESILESILKWMGIIEHKSA